MTDVSKLDPRVEAEGIRVRADVPLELIADRRFVNEDVWLDGRQFVSRLRIAWGHFDIGGNAIDTDCTILMHGFADTVARLVNAFDAARFGGPVN